MVLKNAAMETARAAKTGIDKVNEELEYLQKRLMKYLNIRFFFWLVCQASKDAESPSNLIQSDLQSGGGEYNWLKIMKSLCSFKWLCVL